MMDRGSHQLKLTEVFSMPAQHHVLMPELIRSRFQEPAIQRQLRAATVLEWWRSTLREKLNWRAFWRTALPFHKQRWFHRVVNGRSTVICIPEPVPPSAGSL